MYVYAHTYMHAFMHTCPISQALPLHLTCRPLGRTSMQTPKRAERLMATKSLPWRDVWRFVFVKKVLGYSVIYSSRDDEGKFLFLQTCVTSFVGKSSMPHNQAIRCMPNRSEKRMPLRNASSVVKAHTRLKTLVVLLLKTCKALVYAYSKGPDRHLDRCGHGLSFFNEGDKVLLHGAWSHRRAALRIEVNPKPLNPKPPLRRASSFDPTRYRSFWP